MKNKIYKVLLAALLLLVLIPAAVLAEDAPPADQLASDLTNSYGEWRSRTRSDEFTITYTDYSISAGDDNVRISATIESNIMAECIGVNMIVEQWSGSKWVVYDNFYFVAYDSAYATYTYNMPVEGGHYYRLHANYRAQYMGDFYAANSYSRSVYVN